MRATPLLLIAATLAAPATAQRWDLRGDGPPVRLAGRGVPVLLPELRNHPRGRAFVARNFDANGDRLISPREADAANRAFIELAGADRGGFDWDRRGLAPGDRVAPPRGGWDRAAMRGYGFRQGREGAVMTMQDEVLFRTDSADLRPGALDRLRPLAAYLRDNPGVRVLIAGHTDSRGTAAHNKALSLRRADSVRAAFDAMGVTRARFRVEGRGEAQPIAPNTNAAGMRQNRRVEVTLLGQRADAFRG
ncbi:OmpA family protein [Sphingomonas jatrophae]|uniref:OmpA family protein n=2 Tax=Sphingomonas jatrophae TaxID=1166337 RepID=A0A1I6LMU7_9SPHN|nr:OmpA family protein [Sphingomonas jatrophae]